MNFIYYLGNKLGVKKENYEFECTYAWAVIGLTLFACFALFIPALSIVGICHYIFGVEAKNLNSWPIYTFCIIFYIVLFEDKFHILETFFKYFNKLLDLIGWAAAKSATALANFMNHCVYSFLNRFCKRIEK